MSELVHISGVDLEIVERGSGTPMLFLHGVEGAGTGRPWLEQLARTHRVIVPSHPGFGRSVLPDWFSTVDDLAYLYLDLAVKLGLDRPVLAGNCLGGWIAMEMAIRDPVRFSRLVLVSTLGVKLGGREEREIADFHSMTRDEMLRAAFADPACGRIDLEAMGDMELAAIVRGREAVALYGWKPYMHNPALTRWLHRIDRPATLIWGEEDRIVTPDYGRRLAAKLQNARFECIAKAGHFPHWEQPEAFAKIVNQS